jgi:hypothetical protein
MVRRIRFAALFAVFLLAGLVGAGTAVSNSSGAPATAAKDGCNCHGPLASDASVVLLAPTQYVGLMTYDLKVTVTGPMALPSPVGQNVGGFALLVTAGTLKGGSGVRAEGDFATHTTSGNDQRSWDVKWTAPSGDAEVSVFAAANAVNGDGQQVQDRWNKAVAIIKPAPGANTTSPAATGSSDETPFLSIVGVGAALVLVALVRRRV